MAPSRALIREVTPLLRPCRHLVPAHRRGYASASPTTGKGPLAGIRVLDMTRVLAGVSDHLVTFIPC